MKNGRWALFLSGKGSTVQAALDSFDSYDIRLVVSSNPKALGLLRAKRFGIPTLLCPRNNQNKIDWKQLHSELINRRINRIFLLGFMKLLPEIFLKNWIGKIWNIHPSLLPSFPGLHAMEKSFEAKKDMGVTIHDVIPEMDAGQIVLKKKIISADDLKSTDGNTSHFDSVFLKMSLAEQRMIRNVLIKKDFYETC